MARPGGSLASFDACRPDLVAGIAPRPGPEGRRGRAQAPAATRTAPDEEVSAFEKGSGRAARPSGGAAIRKGFRRASAPGGSSMVGKASAQRRSKGDFEGLRLGEVPRRAGRLRPSVFRKGDRKGFGPDASLRKGRGSGRARSEPGAEAGLRSRRGDPVGIGEGPHGPSARPPGSERGFAASLRDPRKAKRAFAPASQSESRPARDGLATQRRQSKLGQVGAGGDTGPHYDSGRPARRGAGGSIVIPAKGGIDERRSARFRASVIMEAGSSPA